VRYGAIVLNLNRRVFSSYLRRNIALLKECLFSAFAIYKHHTPPE